MSTDEEIKGFYADIGVDTSIIENATGVLETPFKLVPELKLDSTHVFDMVAVVNNRDTVRINWSSLTADYVRSTSAPEAAGVTDAPYLTIAADNTGIYASTGAMWVKSPVYSSNWDDLEGGNTRFLLVNKEMDLSEEEIANARASLNIGIATTDTPGLVKSSDTVSVSEDGTMRVAEAIPAAMESVEGNLGLVRVKNYYTDTDAPSTSVVVTESYVHDAIEATMSSTLLGPATTTALGVVQIEDGNALQVTGAGVISVAEATEDTFGVVKAVRSRGGSEEDQTAVPSEKLVDEKITATRDEILRKVATQDSPGFVCGSSTVTVSSGGVLSVPTATENNAGVVKTQTTISAGQYDTGVAVTPGAVVDYVSNALTNISVSLPPATASKLGAIKVGKGLGVTGDGVLSIVNATGNLLGGVLVSTATGGDSSPTLVPTVAKVVEMIGGQSTQTGGVATLTSYGTVKLGTAVPITDGTPVGINKNGQLYVNLSSGTGGGGGTSSLATYTTSGSVFLSSVKDNLSATTTNNQGLPIGRDSEGRIYVDSQNTYSKATTSKYGLVKLSVSSSTALPRTNPGVGIDEDGCLRVASSGSGSSGTGSYESDIILSGTNYTSEYTAGTLSYDYIGYIKMADSDYKYPILPAATSERLGVSRLGTDNVISGGIPVGVNESGQLSVAVSGEGDLTVSPATYSTAGIVMLGVADTVSTGLPVGINSDGRLYVAATSTDLVEATTTLLGGVRLSTDTTIKNGLAVGLNEAGQLTVASAGTSLGTASYSSLGTVKLGTDVEVQESSSAPVAVDFNDRLRVPSANSVTYGSVKLGTDAPVTDGVPVGVNTSGQLYARVDGASGGSVVTGGGSPFYVSLSETTTGSGQYIVRMTGGAVQMNDGSIINVRPITDEDNLIIKPAEGQVLRLSVYINEYNEPVAKLGLVSDTNVLTAKVVLG